MEYKQSRKYVDGKGEMEEFVVFIIHGKSKAWKDVKNYINEQLNFATIVLIEEVDKGYLLFLFKESIWEDCDCAVATQKSGLRISWLKDLSCGSQQDIVEHHEPYYFANSTFLGFPIPFFCVTKNLWLNLLTTAILSMTQGRQQGFDN